MTGTIQEITPERDQSRSFSILLTTRHYSRYLPSSVTYVYDGLKRLAAVQFPLSTQEGYTYDANSNVLTDTRRDATILTYQYDALNRVT